MSGQDVVGSSWACGPGRPLQLGAPATQLILSQPRSGEGPTEESQGCAPSHGLWWSGMEPRACPCVPPALPRLPHGSSLHACVLAGHSPTRTLIVPGAIGMTCLNSVTVAETPFHKVTFTLAATGSGLTHACMMPPTAVEWADREGAEGCPLRQQAG